MFCVWSNCAQHIFIKPLYGIRHDTAYKDGVWFRARAGLNNISYSQTRLLAPTLTCWTPLSRSCYAEQETVSFNTACSYLWLVVTAYHTIYFRRNVPIEKSDKHHIISLIFQTSWCVSLILKWLIANEGKMCTFRFICKKLVNVKNVRSIGTIKIEKTSEHVFFLIRILNFWLCLNILKFLLLWTSEYS